MISFEQLGIDASILRALEELEFLEPTEIQQKAIPLLLEQNSDLIALAQTGTGKTAAFGIPILQKIDPDSAVTQALIISPTRELCMQITSDLKKYAKHLPDIRILAVYGGSSISAQIKELRRSVHIIVATPGRLMDLMDRKAVLINQVRMVVLDEADEMLNMGFREDMESILSHTPGEKVTALFSATMSTEIREIAGRFLFQPKEVTVGKKNLAQQNITHQYAVVQAKDKTIALKRIVDFHRDFYGIVFCNTKAETQLLSDILLKEGYPVDCLHGDLEQHQRDKVMAKFRHKTIKILFATDVAARGIDVKNLTHIIHFHLPDDIENYTHRSGRTARAGQKGFSIVLLHIKEAYKLHRIEKMANLKFERYTIPTAEQVYEARIVQFVEQVATEFADETEMTHFKNEWIWPLMQMSKERLVEIILRNEVKRFPAGYLNSPDVNIEEKWKLSSSSSRPEEGRSEGRGRARSGRSDSGGSKISSNSRLYVNLGRKDNLKYDEVRDLIFKLTSVSGRAIRDIEMKNTFSFFMTDPESASRLLGKKNLKVKGRDIQFKRAEDVKSERH
ncbi:MAG TPA: DEAD/DEAH box helicase [Saprospiraceae bacterium]|nr:DEAD/DEAH box helicase [Saprospiraceae bacterium]